MPSNFNFVRVLLVTGLIFFSHAILFGGTNENVFEVKRSGKAERRAEAYREAIRRELRSLNSTHPWAGSYYFGDGLGVNARLELASKAGFVFEWHGCLGLYDRNFGKVVEINGGLHLHFELKNEEEGFRGIASHLIPIQWGDRTYLISENKVLDFCNDINAGFEPRRGAHGSYFLREGDFEKLVSGKPKLPKHAESYLLEKPILAQTVRVGKTSAKPGFKDVFVTEVVLDKGAKDLVFQGMRLYLSDPKRFGYVTVTKVDVETCQAEFPQGGDKDRRPKVGFSFSTSCRALGARSPARD
jgi:hypothetical protein